MARSRFAEESAGVDSGAGDDEESAGVEMEDGKGLVDLSTTDESAADYPVIKRGIYDAELIEMEYGRSQRSNNRMWTTVWELTDESLQDAKGNAPRMWLHLTFNEGGMPRVKRFLARIKCDDDANLKLVNAKFDPSAVADEGTLIGAKARLRLTIRRYEGKNRNSVQEVLPPASGSGGSSGFAGI